MSSNSHTFDPKIVEQLEGRSKKAAVIAVAGALLVIVSFGVSISKLHSLRAATEAAQGKLDTINQQLSDKQTQLAETQKKLEQNKSQLAFRDSVYQQLSSANKIPAEALSAAADNAIRENPAAAQQVTPVVNVHISRQDQRPLAEEIEKKLEALGYQVPAIEYVGSKAPNDSQVRYFFKADLGADTEKLTQVMSQFGVPAKVQFIGLQKTPPTLRPRVFEIWLGRDYVPPASAAVAAAK